MLEVIKSVAMTLPTPLPTLLQDTSLAQLGIAAVQATQIPGMFISESNPESSAAYSKFAQGKEKGRPVPSRVAMTWIYTPAAVLSFLASCYAFWGPGFAGSEGDTLRATVVPTMLFVHFAKRVLEVRFLHKFSGEADLSTAQFIGVYYALVAALVTWVTSTVPARAYAELPWTLPVGLGGFVVGVAGNFWHHKLFVELRRDTDKYVIPVGGLFNQVTAPHYLMEIVGWFGIALVSMHLNTFFVWASMTAYLAGRAKATTEYYKEKFGDDWPSERNHLVPMLF